LFHEVAHPDQYQPMWAEHCMYKYAHVNVCIFAYNSLLSALFSTTGVPNQSSE